MKRRATPDGPASLPADLRQALDRIVIRAQELSRKLVAGKPGASVEDFLADRSREAEAE